ncbi:biotin carboxylase N-terminal domain-containing protein [Corynebacterium liangguodongii]|uniref:biotin carboxylase n=1 Tax=Corynebacterium liangguodongii TaxID=2079535 RepID=A0A2S0WCF9_9CORY|nr:biotin carboxylase N-terminal domain-containing protein [Corynebacterium liangguodongii]AWB83453.1 acetyl/propionyl-CoA carboxylase subunit alpha [Corynebacterium liangguodongii]PWC00457.1 acetyl/propionyl-CoA carboxylase subunit alpha [Corynebacterium liangguodongii]
MNATHIDTVLVANRGEIACRIIRTLRAAGVRSVAVYSDADADARHVREADVAVHIGAAPARESYLVAEKILDAATRTGAQAIHPGYGFLSENAEFAKACEDAGIVFIGPPASAIEIMGDKISARAAVEKRGVPTVPGISRPGLSDAELLDAAPGIGFPVLIKPSAGGGGKGMHRVEAIEEMAEALTRARREAAGAFGDDTLFVEHFVDTPRHIEVQILADTHGNVIHLAERECSLQRRHQKVIEEAPSPLLDTSTRAAIGQAACDAARAVNYVGAGTVEFIVPAARPGDFYFMEMNTRLQVEHPVTEEITGLDLVALQLAIARGEKLPLTQDDVRLDGHAMEARIYAEDPANGFLPTGGVISRVIEPTGEHVRVDSGVSDGAEVTSLYDPMLMKVIAHGADRAQALERLDAALANLVITGVGVNTDFNRYLLSIDEVRSGALDTGLLDRVAGAYEPSETPTDVLGLAALELRFSTRLSERRGAWATADGWRLSGGHPFTVRLADTTGEYLVSVVEDAADPGVWITDVEGRETERIEARRRADGFSVVAGGVRRDVRTSVQGADVQVSSPAGTWLLVKYDAGRAAAEKESGSATTLVSPMPGTVIVHSVAEGARVEPGVAVLAVEAMKMEHVLRAEVAGTVAFSCQVGEQVPGGLVLATITPDEDPENTENPVATDK